MKYLRKILLSLLITLFVILVSFQSMGFPEDPSSPFNNNYTHKVFCGIGTAQSCGLCHTLNANMDYVFNQGDQDFVYVSMISEDHQGHVLNSLAKVWENEFNVSAHPTVVVDGGVDHLGISTVDELVESIDEAGIRDVPDLDVSLEAEWLGDARIRLTATITNNDYNPYEGRVRAYVTEIVSRYDTKNGDPYHYGFLDYGINEDISIEYGETYQYSIVWDGSENQDAHGDDFGDIDRDNMQLLLTVSNFDDHYVDATAADRTNINQAPYPPRDPSPGNGEQDILSDCILSWNGGDPDPGDRVKYHLFLGVNSTPDLIATNLTRTYYQPQNLVYNTTYYWRIISVDEHGLYKEGTLWSFMTKYAAIPNLEVIGEIDLSDVSPGETIHAEFIVRNNGDPDSILSWSVIEWPSWGSWVFSPETAETASNESVQVNIDITAPDKRNEAFSGSIIVSNNDDSQQSCSVPVTLTTPYNGRIINIINKIQTFFWIYWGHILDFSWSDFVL